MELYPHNLKAYENVQKAFETYNRTAVIHPTGTGKMYIFLKWLVDHPEESFLFLAPTSAIMYQLKYAMKQNGYKLSDFPNLRCALYCQLLNWTVEDFRNTYSNFVLDEFHRAGAPIWETYVNFLLDTHPDSKVLGLSATPKRYIDHKDMADILFDGNIASFITLAEAMAKGILPLPTYVNTIYSLEGQINEITKKIQTVKYETRRKTLEDLLDKAKSYLSQVEGLDSIFQKFITKKDGKYLIFCKDINHLNEMKTKVQEWFGAINSEIEVYDVHTKHSDEDNESTLQRFSIDKSHKLKLLLSVEMLNEGLHITDIDGVIMLRPTNSYILYLQQLGRGLSIHNDSPLIIDVVNNMESYQNIYGIKKEIEEVIKRNPEECISEQELNANFKIVDYVRNIMETLRMIDESFQLTNLERIEIIKDYIKEGHSYSEITQSTKDQNGYPIGAWINGWRNGGIKLTEEERDILRSMGETFERKSAKDLNNVTKLFIIQKYLKEDHTYASIVQSTKDHENHPIGHWIASWRAGLRSMTDQERAWLMAMGETFERKKTSKLTNLEKIQIIKKYLNEGHVYSEITQSTQDQEGHKIGKWIKDWRYGSVVLTEEERKLLMTIGETFERKHSPRQDNLEKIAVIQQYLNEGHKYKDIVATTVDKNNRPIGQWIAKWRQGVMPLAEEERNTLQSMGEHFETKLSRTSNMDKIKIIREYLQKGHAYSEIIANTIDEYNHPLGRWLQHWRYGKVALTEEERDLLMAMGETFSLGKLKLKVYSKMNTLSHATLQIGEKEHQKMK